jgi:hypothetical protein
MSKSGFHEQSLLSCPHCRWQSGAAGDVDEFTTASGPVVLVAQIQAGGVA